jgi:hypothetical protein
MLSDLAQFCIHFLAIDILDKSIKGIIFILLRRSSFIWNPMAVVLLYLLSLLGFLSSYQALCGSPIRPRVGIGTCGLSLNWFEFHNFKANMNFNIYWAFE